MLLDQLAYQFDSFPELLLELLGLVRSDFMICSVDDLHIDDPCFACGYFVRR